MVCGYLVYCYKLQVFFVCHADDIPTTRNVVYGIKGDAISYNVCSLLCAETVTALRMKIRLMKLLCDSPFPPPSLPSPHSHPSPLTVPPVPPPSLPSPHSHPPPLTALSSLTPVPHCPLLSHTRPPSLPSPHSHLSHPPTFTLLQYFQYLAEFCLQAIVIVLDPGIHPKLTPCHAPFVYPHFLYPLPFWFIPLF